MNIKGTKRLCGVTVLVCLLSCSIALPSWAQTAAAKKVAVRVDNAERRGELNLAAARRNPLQLRHFLRQMPKGADLHCHLGGGVYAESFIRAALNVSGTELM